MRNILLTSAAAVALLASVNVAGAQSSVEPRKEQPAATQKSGGAAIEKKSEPRAQDKSAQEKAAPDKAARGKAPGDKGGEGKAADGKASPDKTTVGKAAQPREKATEGKAQDKSAGDKSAVGKAAKEKVSSDKAASGKVTEGQPPQGKAEGKAAPGKASPDKTTVGQTPRDKAPGDKGTEAKATQDKTNPASKGNVAADSKGSASASITPEKQTKISEVVSKERVDVTNVNFSISVGTAVPERVRVRRLPPDIVRVVPEYRGYDYFVVEEEIIIVEPRTRKVVITIPRHGSRSASISTTSTRLSLSPEKRRLIRELVLKEPIRPVDTQVTLTVGTDIPRAIEVHKFSGTVYREVPELRSYEFFVKDNDVVLVDPRQRKIVEVID
jgi:hypothetical protein